jgi:hypothetical protein
MTNHARRDWILGLFVMLLPTTALAGERGVYDHAGMFGKANVVADINRQIDEIHARYGVDIYIDTFAEVPAGRFPELKQLGGGKFFPMWAEELALTSGADGLYIVICNSPRYIEVLAGPNAHAVFDKRACEKMRKTLSRHLDRKPEEALQETVAGVRDHLASKEEAAKRGGWLWIVWVMLAVLAAWMTVSFIRRFRGEKTLTPPTAISSSALAGQSIYQSVVHKTPEPAPADATTLPYPPPEPKPEGTVHG